MHALFALFIRSLRDDTRSKALLWARVGLAVAVVFAIFEARVMEWRGVSGLDFFESLVWMNVVFIVVAGLSYFASAITEEKEEATLGLLRMTDLSPLAILLGKSTSRFVGGALLLLVQFPFALLAITLGGVHMSQVTGSYAILLAALFFACNAGLLASVISRRTGVAGVWSAGIMGAWTCWMFLVAWGVLLLAGDHVLRSGSFSGWLEERFHGQCPVGAVNRLLNVSGIQFSVVEPCLWLLGGGVLAFMFSLVLFDRCCSESGEAAPGRARKAAGGAGRRGARRATGDAIAWRDFHFFHGGMRVVWIKSAVYLAGAIYLAFEFTWSWFGHEFYFVMLFCLALGFIGLESAFAASRIYRIERKEKTLSSLLILPRDLEDVIRSKRRAVVRSLCPALAGLGIAAVPLVGPIVSNTLQHVEMLFYGPAVAFLTIAQFYFNLRLVAWFSLRMKWGGLPTALALSWVANSIAGFLAAVMFQQAAIIILAICTLIASIMLKRALHLRIEQAAAEE